MHSQSLPMSWDEWGRHDATALAGLVRAGDVTPAELAAQVAAAVGRVDARIEAVLELFEDVVETPVTDRPDPDGLLYGVPFFLKDLGSALRGRRQEMGTQLFRGNIAQVTDPAIENHLSSGLVPIGRSTTPELGATFDTTTNYLGYVKVTRNPWDLSRTPGGSSGGSAALVAAGVTPISMANDGGGSIRLPAAMCGLVGLKASRGRVPLGFRVNELGNRLAVEGVVTRSVRDTAAAFERLTRVPNGGSFIAMGPPEGSYLEAIKRAPGRLQIGLSTGNWGRSTPVDSVVAARVREVAHLMEQLGHRIEEVDDSAICNWDAMWRGFVSDWIMGAERGIVGMQAAGIDVSRLEEKLSPVMFKMVGEAKRFSKADIWAVAAFNNLVTRGFGATMQRYDVLLTPTLAIRTPLANGPFSMLSTTQVGPWFEDAFDAVRFTAPANETGLPAISVPAGLDPDGLPIGVQFYGNFRAEPLLLQIAAQIEAARPEWFGAAPPVHVSRAELG